MTISKIVKLAGLLELRADYRDKRDAFGEGFEKTMAGELLEILEEEIEIVLKQINDEVRHK